MLLYSTVRLNVMAHEKKQPAPMGKQGGTSTSA